MSTSILEGQKAALIAGLTPLYRTAQLVQAGSPVSDGRGGFTASTISTDIQIQIESQSESLAVRNINPDEALIFILNGGSATPNEGDSISADTKTYMINNLTLDPVGAVYECVCGKG